MTSNIYGHLGKLIQNKRKSKKLTQEEFSKVIGMNRVTLARIESGNKKIFFDDLVKIMSNLGISIFELNEVISMNSLDDEIAQQNVGQSDINILKELLG
jgi:transcriptional regulator with XRE-family HTH domain